MNRNLVSFAIAALVSFSLAAAFHMSSSTGQAQAVGICPGRWHAEVIRVVDGDTVDVRVDLGWDVLTHQRLRLARINAPEVRGPERAAGLRSSTWLRSRLEGAAPHSITVGPPSGGRLRRGRYGRFITELCVGRTSIGDEMMRIGMARRYGR